MNFSIAQFIAGLRIIRYRHKGHIKHDLRVEPAAVDGKFPSTRAAMTLSGVLSMLGVFTAASRRPSIASSSIKTAR